MYLIVIVYWNEFSNMTVGGHAIFMTVIQSVLLNTLFICSQDTRNNFSSLFSNSACAAAAALTISVTPYPILYHWSNFYVMFYSIKTFLIENSRNLKLIEHIYSAYETALLNIRCFWIFPLRHFVEPYAFVT